MRILSAIGSRISPIWEDASYFLAKSHQNNQ